MCCSTRLRRTHKPSTTYLNTKIRHTAFCPGEKLSLSLGSCALVSTWRLWGAHAFAGPAAIEQRACKVKLSVQLYSLNTRTRAESRTYQCGSHDSLCRVGIRKTMGSRGVLNLSTTQLYSANTEGCGANKTRDGRLRTDESEPQN